MSFSEELQSLLPPELPHREDVVDRCARHLELIVETNRQFNLTRITDPRVAAIKHVLDSLMPLELFAEARHVMDAGTGAGFPGIPLALALPMVRFTLSESTGKKARFVQSVVEQLALPNVEVVALRAEEALRTMQVNVITARAVAPIERALGLFLPALKRGARVLLYKGPDAQSELEAAQGGLRRHHVRARIVQKYELPESLGARTIVELSC